MAIRMEAISLSHWGSQEQTPYMFPYDHLTRWEIQCGDEG